jgi:hypothetical protein
MWCKATLPLLLVPAVSCSVWLTGCGPNHAPLAGVVPLRCALPSPPQQPVPEQLVCELVGDFAIPEEYRGNIRERSSTPVGKLVLDNIEVRGATSAAPLPVAEELCRRLVTSDVCAQLQRIPEAEYRAEYWHSSQKIRYQSVIDGISMPCSYAEFTVWHPTRASTQVLANVEGMLFRVASRGDSTVLLGARTAFERSHLWESVQTIEPVTRVYLRYLPKVVPGVGSQPTRQITVRPVWCFFGNDRLVGDIIVGQRFLVDAVNGTEFRQIFSR